MKHAERNWDGIQHEELRRKVDPQYNELHDALTEAYYAGHPFSWGGMDYGVLTKEQFDELHGVIFHMRDIEFHEQNQKQPKEKQIPEEEYNHIIDTDGILIAKNYDLAVAKVTAFNASGKQLKVRLQEIAK